LQPYEHFDRHIVCKVGRSVIKLQQKEWGRCATKLGVGGADFAPSRRTMTLNLEQRRALEMLAPRPCPGVGANEFDAAMLTNLVNAEVASLPPERLRAGGRSIDVTAPRAAQRLEIGEPRSARPRPPPRHGHAAPLDQTNPLSMGFSSLGRSMPMRRTRSPCCARAASGHAAAPPSPAPGDRFRGKPPSPRTSFSVSG
jgi:hypothetical protein